MRPPEKPHHDWMDARVEAYLDDELPADERAAFEQTLAYAADWEAEVFLARQIHEGLRTLPEPVCPPHVTEAVLAYTRREARASWLAQFHAWMQQQFTALWQPALAMTVVLVLVVSASLIGRPSPPPPTDPAVAQALAEVKLAFRYVSQAGRQTGKVVRDDVIAERVVGPVQNALNARQQPSDDTQR